MDSKKLTDQQRYLLNRIPGINYMRGDDPIPEPSEVKRARRVIERWTKAQALRECRARKRNEALITKAKEAVYFASPEKALRIVQQCEKMLKGCPV